ncbi:MAG: thioredoxin family protein [Pirellulaceae bacterium]|nr:thioredoxin family protein [Pirellulaceae bacterium]
MAFDRARTERYQIRRIPTFVFISGGEEVRRISGNASTSRLRYLFRSPSSFF